MRARHVAGAALSLWLVMGCEQRPVPPSGFAQAAAPAPGPGEQPQQSTDAPWPRRVEADGYSIEIYQPEIERWEGDRLDARAAVSLETAASPQPRFGVAWLTARTQVDKEAHLVALEDVQVTRVSFPAEPGKGDEYAAAIRKGLPAGVATVSLDRLQASLAVGQATGQARAVAVKNDPPRILFSSAPATLVLVDGQPVLRQEKETSLLRIVNTRALIVLDRSTGRYYLRLLGRWAEAGSLDGPWSVAKSPPASLDAALKAASATGQVELLDDLGPYVGEAAKGGVLPAIYVSTVPAELLQTEGEPKLGPIAGTQLLEVENTSATILLDLPSQEYYVLISGRWFRSRSLTDGPWTYQPNDQLPADFTRIPEPHPKGAALASVTGTPQSQEALIENTIPQTAAVDRSRATLSVPYDGDPQFQPIEGTPLQYAVNSPFPVIRVDQSSYYAVQNGVWFVATSPTGPWAVAASVPAVIYTIPPDSPMHYVTYVQVYRATPETVYVGYTPGYYGTVVAPTSVVVYGTGFSYVGWVTPSVWYPPPVTYGFGAGFSWGAVTGFTFGVAFGAAWGWGPWGWGGPHGDVDININRANVYNRWDRDVAVSRPQVRGPERQPLPSGGRANDVFAGRDGHAYQQGPQGWERHDESGWSRADVGEAASRLDSEQRARVSGAAAERAHAAGGTGGRGGSPRGGGRPGRAR